MGRARAVALASAMVAVRPTDESAVSFGAEVRFRDSRGRVRTLFLASAGEIGLVPEAASVTSPLARALLGARAGDVVEVEGPSGVESFHVMDVRFPE
jgi:transcription elongation GreA/GreB family factor